MDRCFVFMNFLRTLFLLAVSFSFSSKVFSAPTILNPSFEDNHSYTWPGSSAIVGWAGTFNTGINPLAPELEPAFAAYRSANPANPLYRMPFADNGKVPHGLNVAFLQGGPHDEFTNTFTTGISQPISNFETGKKYAVV